MEIKIVTVDGTPAFVAPTTHKYWQRVYGATEEKKNNRWLFPAYEPFLTHVLHDLPKVQPEVTFSPEAATWCAEYMRYDANREWVGGLQFSTTSYDHQLDGVAELLTNYRWGLRWGMGTGKTKVVIDTVSILKQKTLVLCPLVAVDNWVKETQVHSGGQLRAIAFKAPSRAKKLTLLSTLKNYDIIVTSFDTAKLYGIPSIFPSTLELFGCIGNKVLSTPMRRLFSRINDATIQSQLALDWLCDRKKPREIRAEIDALTCGKEQWLWQLPYEMIIADESHRIANRKSIRTKVCLELAKKASRRVLLSGTMVGGDPAHLYPQLKFLAPYLMPEDTLKFEEKYFIKSPRDTRIVIGYRKIHILNNRVSSVTSERLLDECVDLPARRVETISFPLSRAQKRDYNYIVKTSTLVLPDSSELEIANGAVRNGKLLQICSGFLYVPAEDDACDTCPYMRQCVAEKVKLGSTQCGSRANLPAAKRKVLRYPTNPKLDLLVEKLKDLVLWTKVIVWTALTEELDAVCAALDKNKWGYVRVDGTTTKHMSRWEDKFRDDDTCRVYAAQITTGIAVTLNTAQYMIYYSRDFKPDSRNQSMERNHRIGQNKKTVVYDLCAERSLELQQLKALGNKDEISALLTNKVECTLCQQYAMCREENISPWEKKCVLSTEKKRVIMKARTI